MLIIKEWVWIIKVNLFGLLIKINYWCKNVIILVL